MQWYARVEHHMSSIVGAGPYVYAGVLAGRQRTCSTLTMSFRIYRAPLTAYYVGRAN